MNNSKNLLSNTKSLVLLGVFIALGAILMLIEIPYPPVPFLKFDLSELIVLLTVEVFGLVPAIIVAAAKSIVNIMLGMSATYMHRCCTHCLNNNGLFIRTCKKISFWNYSRKQIITFFISDYWIFFYFNTL